MPEDAAQIAREAKGLHQGLKESLKTREPWDKDVGFQRKNLRWQYLRLLFVHPFAPESRDAETHLWMQTSYSFITIYKRRIAAFDSAKHGPPRQNHQQQQQRHGVEYRRLLPRFRQFLSDEEKFWTQLIIRIRRSYALDDAHGALVTLDIVPKDDAPTSSPEGPPPRREFPVEADSASPALASATPAQLESRMPILSKALVCLGDIARYKEQYNEAGGRPRAGHEDGPPAVVPHGRNGRNRRGGAASVMPPTMARMRDYKRALECYEQARLLLPHDGNPSHQMAILASYQKDVFNSLVHYYRSLCVRRPYDTALENMLTALQKTLDQWKSKQAVREDAGDDGEKSGLTPRPRERVFAFKEKLIAMHALWRLAPDEIGSTWPHLDQDIIHEFKTLVSERILPDDTISKTFVLAQGALWTHRITRRSSGRGIGIHAETRITSHLLGLHRALLEVGIAQLAEPPAEDVGDSDLAQRITAPFRRTLPALRLAGKWIRGNVGYVGPPPLARAQPPFTNGGHSAGRTGDKHSVVPVDDAQSFWKTYADFANALSRSFPFDKLPALSGKLEEDREMSGFLPLGNFMFSEVKAAGSARAGPASTVSAPAPGQGHPNEEQLMRISDILADARALANDENSPLVLSNNQFTIQYSAEAKPVVYVDDRIPATNIQQSQHSVQESAPSAKPQDEPERHDVDDDNLTEFSRTTDDPVGDAMREALDHSGMTDLDDGSDDDVVVYPKPDSPSRLGAPASTLPTTPQRSKPASPPTRLSPPGVQPLSPRSRHVGIDTTPVLGPRKPHQTAEDLLHGLTRKANPGEFPQPQLNHSGPLFGSSVGSSALGSSTHSIWSPSFDSNAPRYPGAAGTSLSSSHHSNAIHHANTVSTTSSAAYSAHIQDAPAAFVSPIQRSPPINGHQRTLSQSFTLTQSSNLSQSQFYDPSRYLVSPQPPNSSLHNRLPQAYVDPTYPSSLTRSHYRSVAPGYQGYPAPFLSDVRSSQSPTVLDPSMPSGLHPWSGAG